MSENKPGFFENIKNKFFGKKEISSQEDLVKDYEKVRREHASEQKISSAEARIQLDELKKIRDEELKNASPQEKDLLNQEFDKSIDDIYSKIDKKELFKLENAEDYIDLINTLSPEEFRLMQIEKEYGSGRFNKFRAYLKGEYDFSIEENGNVKRNIWTEFSRKALNTVFNRRTALQAGALGVVGILTGGVNIAASAYTFVGSSLGRGGVEFWSSVWGKEGQSRKELAEEYAKGWMELKKKGKEINKSGITEEEKNNKIYSLVESYCNFDTTVINKKEELQEVKKETDIYREKWSKYGALAGLGANFIAGGFAHLKELITAHKMDFDTLKATHDVVMTKDGHLASLYNSAEELAKAKAGYMLEKIDPQTGQELYKYVSAHGVDPSKLLPLGEHMAHTFKEGWMDYAKYFFGVGQNLAREGAVLAGTYIAGMEGIVKAGRKGETKEEKISKSQMQKEKILEPLNEKIKMTKDEAEARAKEPYNQANVGDQWILYFDNQPVRVEIKSKSVDPRTNEEIIIFEDIDNTGLMKINGKSEGVLDYTRDKFNNMGKKVDGVLSGKWENKNYSIDEWDYMDKELKKFKSKEDIEDKYIKWTSNDTKLKFADKDNKKLEDVNYKVYKIDPKNNEMIIYDAKEGSSSENQRKFKLTDLLHGILSFEENVPSSKQETEEAEKGKTDIEKVNEKLEKRTDLPEGINKIEKNQFWEYEGEMYQIYNFSKDKKKIIAWKLTQDAQGKFKKPQVANAEITNLDDFAENAQFREIALGQERQEKKQNQRNQ